MKIAIRIEFDDVERLRLISEIPEDELSDVIKALVEGVTLYIREVLELESPTVDDDANPD